MNPQSILTQQMRESQKRSFHVISYSLRAKEDIKDEMRLNLHFDISVAFLSG